MNEHRCSNSMHIMPKNDLILHVSDDDCVCGPQPEMVKRGDGSVGWLMVHHSLHGRELKENQNG